MALFTVDVTGGGHTHRLEVGSRDMLHIERRTRVTLMQIVSPQNGVNFAALYRAVHALMRRAGHVDESMPLAEFEDTYDIDLVADAADDGGDGDPTTPTA